ncbi:MAG: 2OG-Fe(II) oxygenase [Sediminibacterium sp.]
MNEEQLWFNKEKIILENNDSIFIKKIKNHEFNYIKNEKNNKIVEIKDIVSKDFSKIIIQKSEEMNGWKKVGFHKAEVLEQVNNVGEKNDMFSNCIKEYMENVKAIFNKIYNKPVIFKSIYIQKWPPGSYGLKHNDTHNLDGSPGFIDWKLSVLLYLHSDFVGGKLEFPDHNISIVPNQGSGYFFEGGPQNEHQVTTIETGLRYTIVSFWDFEDSVYDKNDILTLKENEKKWAEYMKNKNLQIVAESDIIKK